MIDFCYIMFPFSNHLLRMVNQRNLNDVQRLCFGDWKNIPELIIWENDEDDA